MKLLIVDDDADLRAILGFALRDAGFVVVEAAGAAAALERAEAELPDLVVLDLNLGRDDGLEVLPQLRAREGNPRPVLVLSVRAAEEDVVRALDLGADDYLTKPFSPRTLLARVRALLRRAGGSAPDLLVAGDLRLDLERRSLEVGARPAVRLTPLEARLVQFLIARAGETVPTERLLVHIWGGRGEGDRQLLKQLVHRLRQKIEPDPAAPRYVVTEAGEGYRLETTTGAIDPSDGDAAGTQSSK
ncbi:MAG: DNA-binding response regulator [Acidobacteriota bacterium]